jgi:hypothetical protein
MSAFKSATLPTLEDASEFVQNCLDAGIQAAAESGYPPPNHYLNHATHANTFILIFSDARLASWMITYEEEGVEL